MVESVATDAEAVNGCHYHSLSFPARILLKRPQQPRPWIARAAAAQTVTVIADGKDGKTKVEFQKNGDVLVSKFEITFALSPRRGRIVRRLTDNSRDWIAGQSSEISETACRGRVALSDKLTL